MRTIVLVVLLTALSGFGALGFEVLKTFPWDLEGYVYLPVNGFGLFSRRDLNDLDYEFGFSLNLPEFLVYTGISKKVSDSVRIGLRLGGFFYDFIYVYYSIFLRMERDPFNLDLGLTGYGNFEYLTIPNVPVIRLGISLDFPESAAR